MDIQKQIEFEKFHARECNCDYDELKRRLDHQEKVMGHRYIPSSPRHEAWLVWNAAWKAKAQAVPEWNSVDDKEPPLGTMVLICWSDAPDVEPEKDYMDHDVDHGVNYWANYNDGDEPSHWMLLPKPVAQEQSHD